MDSSQPGSPPIQGYATRLDEALRPRDVRQLRASHRTLPVARDLPLVAPRAARSVRVHDGFERLPDGSVTLRCRVPVEHAILVPIVETMAGTYRGDARGNPFEALRQLRCPIRIATTEGSQPIFKYMSEAASRLIPKATTHHFEGVGHSVAQVQPELVAAAALRFWADGA